MYIYIYTYIDVTCTHTCTNLYTYTDITCVKIQMFIRIYHSTALEHHAMTMTLYCIIQW